VEIASQASKARQEAFVVSRWEEMRNFVNSPSRLLWASICSHTGWLAFVFFSLTRIGLGFPESELSGNYGDAAAVMIWMAFFLGFRLLMVVATFVWTTTWVPVAYKNHRRHERLSTSGNLGPFLAANLIFSGVVTALWAVFPKARGMAAFASIFVVGSVIFWGMAKFQRASEKPAAIPEWPVFLSETVDAS
jgi:hypothetical protein